MTWVSLDDKFHSNPKILAIGNDGAGLYARSLSYCGAHLTDGFVSMTWARAAASPRLRGKLVQHGLWTEVAGGYHIPDYLDKNPSKDDVLARRVERSEAGKKGAKARWGDGNSHSSAIGSRQNRLDAPNPNPIPGFVIPLSVVKDSAPTVDDFELDPDKAAVVEKLWRAIRPQCRRKRTLATIAWEAKDARAHLIVQVTEELRAVQQTVRDDGGWAIERLRTLKQKEAS